MSDKTRARAKRELALAKLLSGKATRGEQKRIYDYVRTLEHQNGSIVEDFRYEE